MAKEKKEEIKELLSKLTKEINQQEKSHIRAKLRALGHKGGLRKKKKKKKKK